MGRRRIDSWLMDMDGVLVREEAAVPGADTFVATLRERGTPFLVLTNNSIYTPRDLAARLRASGIEVPEANIWTSALATAHFLQDQRPGGSAFVVGEAGLTTALHDAGYTLTERSPDYVVLGETRSYSFERITRAIRLIDAGARFIATNPDATGPTLEGLLPATGAVAALVTRATGVEPYYVGKPNPLMMRSALNAIDAHSETTAMVGDRMDTDVVSGIEAGLETILVLTGSTTRAQIGRFPYLPSRVVESVADLLGEHLVAVAELLDAARANRGGALVVRGEGGIGKSALLAEAQARAEGMTVLRAVGVESEAELPFASLHQVLAGGLDRLDRLPEPHAAALRGAFGMSLDRVDDRFLISLGALGLLGAMAEERPVLVAVDDAWASSPAASAPSRSRCSSPPARARCGASRGQASRSCASVASTARRHAPCSRSGSARAWRPTSRSASSASRAGTPSPSSSCRSSSTPTRSPAAPRSRSTCR